MARRAKKLGLGLLALLGLSAAAGFTFGPGIAEDGMNKIDGKSLPPVTAEAKALHATLTIVDLHGDSLLWDRDITRPSERGQIDLPRLQKGNVALQIFSSVSKTPKGQNYESNSADTDNITLLAIAQLQPISTWSSLLARSLHHAKKLDEAVAASGGELVKIAAPRDVDRLLLAMPGEKRPIGALFSAEGLHNLEGKRENLDRLHAAGLRMAGLTHFFDNELAGSMHGEKKGGLTPFGREIMAAMEAKGIIVDIAHCSHQCVADILASATRPVVSSHGGVQATCKENRNLTDEEIKGVAATGGVIGVGYWEGAVCDTSPEAIVKAMTHIRDLVGIRHIALGSDFDGAVTTRFDTSQLVQITQELMRQGYPQEDIRAIMGGNALRVLRAGIAPPAPVKVIPAK